MERMDDFLKWFAIIHIAAYAIAGFSLAAILFANWLVERFKLKAALVQAYARILKERAASKGADQ